MALELVDITQDLRASRIQCDRHFGVERRAAVQRTRQWRRLDQWHAVLARGFADRQRHLVDTLGDHAWCAPHAWRSGEHTSELQSLMRTSYAVFCLKKKKYP